MATEHFSVLYNILDWQKKNKKYVDTDLLIGAFINFNKSDQSEVQELVLDILHEKKEKLNASQLEEFSFNISTPKISQKFQSNFPNFKINKQLWDSQKPKYIEVDSVLSLGQENILVEIATNKGEITVELFSKVAPLTVKNFLELAKKGFYTKTIFHRVIADFVIQGGDPGGDGWGGAGYTIASEDFLTFERGTIGIATSGFDTGSCQFFICQSEQPHLRGNYTAFGKVTEGFDVVDNIQIDDIILSIKPISQK
ncbi:MAG: peptidylprolyl isomerase [Calditrichaeota bacterium]|nr:MAG: peptidylprolyl isomerase [Calditrichota bacterium]MBL1205443.1 peptidylprolyl isomerase [Calditrichota bacterium]NOG45272.1 peptidylprolyl isomerase [Calditrichota bacterium]